MSKLGIPAAMFLAAALTGCGMFGFSPPVDPLLKDAKEFREVAPVPAPVPRELAKELLPTFVVEPGDTLLVQPVELDTPVRFPPDQLVFLDGTIDLGIYGRPVVAGRTLVQIEPMIQDLVNTKERERAKEKAAFLKEKEPEFRPVPITVRLIGRVSKVYYVLGEVHSPNAYPLSGRETVLDAIVQAGGLSHRAARDQIVLSRPTPPEGCRVLLPVCYDQIVQLGDTSTNYQLMPGDRVFVPSQGMLASLLPFAQQRCGCRGGPCCRPQVSCFGGGCASPNGGCATTVPATSVVHPPVPAGPATLPTIPATLPNTPQLAIPRAPGYQ
jgi:protein involved in polysaccharide export with SLBB domain